MHKMVYIPSQIWSAIVINGTTCKGDLRIATATDVRFVHAVACVCKKSKEVTDLILQKAMETCKDERFPFPHSIVVKELQKIAIHSMIKSVIVNDLEGACRKLERLPTLYTDASIENPLFIAVQSGNIVLIRKLFDRSLELSVECLLMNGCDLYDTNILDSMMHVFINTNNIITRALERCSSWISESMPPIIEYLLQKVGVCDNTKKAFAGYVDHLISVYCNRMLDDFAAPFSCYSIARPEHVQIVEISVAKSLQILLKNSSSCNKCILNYQSHVNKRTPLLVSVCTLMLINKKISRTKRLHLLKHDDAFPFYDRMYQCMHSSLNNIINLLIELGSDVNLTGDYVTPKGETFWSKSPKELIDKMMKKANTTKKV